MTIVISLEDGKYTLTEKIGTLVCERYGEPWRDVTGDKMIGAMFTCIVAQQARITELEAQLASSKQEWILVSDRLPELVVRTTPYELDGNKAIPPTLKTQTVLVSLHTGHVRTDQWSCIEGEPGWWNAFGGRVRAWMPLPEALK